MTEQTDNYGDCIIFLLAKAYQRAHGLLKEELKPFGLTPVQQLVVSALWLEDGLSAGQLGRRLTLDPATLSGVIDRLVDSGWVVKSAHPSDGRAVMITLSNRGRDRAGQVVETRRAVNDRILSGLRLEEQLLLKRLLADLGPRSPE